MKGSYHLSDLNVPKIEIRCECGMTRRYDRLALIDRLGDHDLPSLLRKLAAAEGCEKAAQTVDLHAICQMGYAPSCIVDGKAREAAIVRERESQPPPPRRQK